MKARDQYIVDVKPSQEGSTGLSKEQKRKYKRVKNLLNIGEVSYALSALLRNDVADVDGEILNQHKAKHPSRPEGLAFDFPVWGRSWSKEMKDASTNEVEMTDSKDSTCSRATVFEEYASNIVRK